MRDDCWTGLPQCCSSVSMKLCSCPPVPSLTAPSPLDKDLPAVFAPSLWLLWGSVTFSDQPGPRSGRDKNDVQPWLEKAIGTVAQVRRPPYLRKRLLSASCCCSWAAAPEAEPAAHSAADVVVPWEARGNGHVSGPSGFAERGRWDQTSPCSPHRTARLRPPGN